MISKNNIYEEVLVLKERLIDAIDRNSIDNLTNAIYTNNENSIENILWEISYRSEFNKILNEIKQLLSHSSIICDKSPSKNYMILNRYLAGVIYHLSCIDYQLIDRELIRDYIYQSIDNAMNSIIELMECKQSLNTL